MIKQLTVFLENTEGSLEDVLNILKNAEINIKSLSLADTTDFGILRLIVSDPDKGYDTLKENFISARLVDVNAVRIEHKVGELQELLASICKAGINIEYMYSMAATTDASIVFKTSNPEKAKELAEAEGIHIITQDEI